MGPSRPGDRVPGLADLLDHPVLQFGAGRFTIGTVLGGLLVLAATLVVARVAGRSVARLLAVRGQPSGAQLALGKVTTYVVTIVGLGVALSTAGLDLTAVFAASTILLVGLGFGLQNVAQNFVSGLILLVEQPIRPGDFVQVGNTFGEVDDIGLRATRIITRDRVAIFVPNSELATTQVVNHSRPTSDLRISVEVGVAYGSDVALVQRTLLGCARAAPRVLADPPPEVRFAAFGDSSLDFSLLCWIADPREDLRVASSLRFAIDAAFRQAGINIPFPQRDLHVKTWAPRPPGVP
jgi:small-conductance mechanosensitive channel